ncbi:MAG: hypothetical protein CK425_03590 [Parachlamydia sp.]|nr:MAG: hypothetical protein CK425_03590 [Parachlamydia sp.]
MHYVTASDSTLPPQDRTLDNHGISTKAAQPPLFAKRDSKLTRENSATNEKIQKQLLADTLIPSASSGSIIVHTPRSAHREPPAASDVKLVSPQYETEKDLRTDSSDLLEQVVGSPRFSEMVDRYSEPSTVRPEQLKKTAGGNIHSKTTTEAVLSPRYVSDNRRESKGKEKIHEPGSTNWLDSSSLNGKFRRLQDQYGETFQESDDQGKNPSEKGSGRIYRSERFRRFTKKEGKEKGEIERVALRHMPPKAESDVAKHFKKGNHFARNCESYSQVSTKPRPQKSKGGSLISFSPSPEEFDQNKFAKLPNSPKQDKCNGEARKYLKKHLKSRIQPISLDEVKKAIWRQIHQEAEAICREKKFLSSKAADVELLHSPRVKKLIDSMTENQEVLGQIRANMETIRELLFKHLKSLNYRTDWLVAFINTLNDLIDSSLGSFMKIFSSADTPMRVILIEGIGAKKERDEIIKMLNSWREEYVFENEITEILKSKERFFLSLNSLSDKEFEVPIKSYRGEFFLPKKLMLENLEQRKIYDIPHYVNKKKLKVSGTKSGGPLKEFFLKLLQALYSALESKDTEKIQEEVDKLFTYDYISADYLIKFLHFGHFRFSQIVQKMFPSIVNKDSNLSPKPIGCWIKFDNFEEFSMTFELGYPFHNQSKLKREKVGEKLSFIGKFIFKLELTPDIKKDELSFIKGIVRIKEYEFSENVPVETQYQILGEILDYSIPRGSRLSNIHTETYYTQKGDDKRIQASLEEALTTISPPPPTRAELIDRYKNTCRKEIETKGKTFSVENVRELLNKNEAFFETMVPRFTALEERLSIILERTRSDFSDALVPVIQNIIKSFGDTISPREINRQVDITKFLNIYHGIENPHIKRIVLLVLAPSEQEANDLIRYLKSSIKLKNIEKTLKVMLLQKKKFEQNVLHAKLYLLRPTGNLKTKMLKNEPSQVLRSYTADGNVLFDSIKINSSAFICDPGEKISQQTFFEGFLKVVYSHFDPERSEGRIREEVAALLAFGTISWNKVVNLFGKKKPVKKLNMDALKKLFSYSGKACAAIPWDDVLREWELFKIGYGSRSPKAYSHKTLKRSLISWFTCKTIPCYHILVSGSVGMWRIVPAILQPTFKEAYAMPLSVATHKGIRLEIHIKNDADYTVCASRVLGVHARKYRWRDDYQAVDSKKPLVKMRVRAFFNFRQNEFNKTTHECLLKIDPPRFFEKNIDFKEDKYRIWNLYQKANPVVDLTLVSRSFKKKDQKKTLKLKELLSQEEAEQILKNFPNDDEYDSTTSTGSDLGDEEEDPLPVSELSELDGLSE